MNFNSLKVNIKGRKYAFIIFYFKYNPSKKTLNKLNVKIMKYKLLLYLTRTFFSLNRTSVLTTIGNLTKM